MEQAFSAHPIPQNVTNFEFHLVGDMTLKQFGYLASGLGTAYITFIIPGFVTRLPFIAWPLIVIFAAVGAAFAFLPIQERPLDHWVAAFIKAILKPTKLKFESKVLPAEDPLFAKRLNFYLAIHKKPDFENTVVGSDLPVLVNSGSGANMQPSGGITPSKYQLTNQTTQTFVSHEPPKIPQSSMQILPPIITKVFPPSEKSEETSPLTENEQLKKTVELAREAQATQTKILSIEKTLADIKSTAAAPGADPNSYVSQFETVLTDLQKLNAKASSLSHELADLSRIKPTAPAANKILPDIKPPYKPSPVMQLTAFPNVINGIVTDSKGNYIEGAIVVTHDKQGLPVRALKSNKLGQFIAATPLPSGMYTINTEKEGLQFDSVQIELLEKVLNPVVLSAKKIDPVIR